MPAAISIVFVHRPCKQTVHVVDVLQDVHAILQRPRGQIEPPRNIPTTDAVQQIHHRFSAVRFDRVVRVHAGKEVILGFLLCLRDHLAERFLC